MNTFTPLWKNKCSKGHVNVQMHKRSPGGYCMTCRAPFDKCMEEGST